MPLLHCYVVCIFYLDTSRDVVFFLFQAKWEPTIHTASIQVCIRTANPAAADHWGAAMNHRHCPEGVCNAARAWVQIDRQGLLVSRLGALGRDQP